MTAGARKKRPPPPDAPPAAIVSKTFTLTAELAARLDADRALGVSTSALTEAALRRHYRMPRRPDVSGRGYRWQPGESGNPRGKAPREPAPGQGEPSGDGTA